MDAYTRKTRSWLDDRFKVTDEHGIYFAHQPIYGFRVPPCEPGLVERYTITYQVLNALGSLRFQSVVDVGGAEGYKSALIRKLLGARVYSCDLSAEAVKRSQEIFGIPGEPVDIHRLPFEDGAFDVAVCSETLEHVPDFQAATRELIRVARTAVVITVPREPEELIRRNIEEGHEHAHIHALNLGSFDFAKEFGCSVEKRRLNSGLLKVPRELVEARPRPDYGARKFPRWLYDSYNLLCPLMKRIFGRRAAAWLVRCDDWVSNRTDSYSGLCFIIVKDPAAWRPRQERRRVRVAEILDFAVPPHRPGHPRGPGNGCRPADRAFPRRGPS